MNHLYSQNDNGHDEMFLRNALESIYNLYMQQFNTAMVREDLLELESRVDESTIEKYIPNFFEYLFKTEADITDVTMFLARMAAFYPSATKNKILELKSQIDSLPLDSMLDVAIGLAYVENPTASVDLIVTVLNIIKNKSPVTDDDITLVSRALDIPSEESPLDEACQESSFVDKYRDLWQEMRLWRQEQRLIRCKTQLPPD